MLQSAIGSATPRGGMLAAAPKALQQASAASGMASTRQLTGQDVQAGGSDTAKAKPSVAGNKVVLQGGALVVSSPSSKVRGVWHHANAASAASAAVLHQA